MPKLGQCLSPWQAHFNRWNNCTLCRYHEHREHVVLARGDIPCDVLFIGEAPGLSEDEMGWPFVDTAPAGEMFQQIVDSALAPFTPKLRYAVTNVLACIPTDEEGRKEGDPDRECAEACRPRLDEFIKMCKPKLVVRVGKLADKHVPCGEYLEVSVIHPSSIIRQEAVSRPITIKRQVVAISDAISRLL